MPVFFVLIWVIVLKENKLLDRENQEILKVA